jgi:putative transcriptional regulator
VKTSKEAELKKLGARLKTLRLEKGLTMEVLAYECDTDVSQIHRIESGKINPMYTTLRNLANGLGVSVSELMKGL